jgi:uncharacterized damage-inducible protein DinB
MERNRIDDFATGGRKLIRAIDGLSREDLLWPPPPQLQIGRWSIQQVVFHLMDDELIWTDRMKRVIAEENPKILNYDESKFAAKLFCEEQDARVAAELLDANRRQFAIVLGHLPDTAFARTGDHNDIGIFTLAQAITWTAEHLDHHIYYIAMKRQKLAKPLTE